MAWFSAMRRWLGGTAPAATVDAGDGQCPVFAVYDSAPCADWVRLSPRSRLVSDGLGSVAGAMPYGDVPYVPVEGG